MDVDLTAPNTGMVAKPGTEWLKTKVIEISGLTLGHRTRSVFHKTLNRKSNLNSSAIILLDSKIVRYKLLVSNPQC